MTIAIESRNRRITSALAAVVVHGVLGYAFITGLAVDFTRAVGDNLKLFTIASPPPPPPLEKIAPRPIKSSRPEGAASPPNLRSRATQLVAPKPIVPPVVPPPPVVVALKAGVGSDASAGAADIAGPGTGSGGLGDGTGSGGAGDGDGYGGAETPPRLIRGRIRDSDYPRGLGEAGISGVVSIRFLVGVDGRVSRCQVTRSSGSRELDETTCRLIEQRFRYAPSRDEDGQPVPTIVSQRHFWEIRHDEDSPYYDGPR